MYGAAPEYDCPCCSYHGLFDHFGGPLYHNLQCPRCGSHARQRLFALAMRDGFVSFHGRHVIHFAPDRAFKLGVVSDCP